MIRPYKTMLVVFKPVLSIENWGTLKKNSLQSPSLKDCPFFRRISFVEEKLLAPSWVSIGLWISDAAPKIREVDVSTVCVYKLYMCIGLYYIVL